ncbi:MAG: hypothetical protein KG012_00785 [Deltaproteobacteria bacterium]|nr:hypothetical protein [Deltaproteobacteria bacterium]
MMTQWYLMLTPFCGKIFSVEMLLLEACPPPPLPVGRQAHLPRWHGHLARVDRLEAYPTRGRDFGENMTD